MSEAREGSTVDRCSSVPAAAAKIVECAGRVESACIVFLFVIMTVVCFYQVLCRYVLKISAPWTEELDRYAMIWLVMLGSSWAISADHHIKIDAIYSVVKRRRSVAILRTVLDLFILGFCARFAYASFVLIPQVRASGLISVGMDIPAYVPMLAMPVGGVLMTVHAVCAAVLHASVLFSKDGGE